MKIKKGHNIEVTFYAEALKDVDATMFSEWLMDKIPNMRVNNPSYRLIEDKSGDYVEIEPFIDKDGKEYKITCVYCKKSKCYCDFRVKKK